MLYTLNSNEILNHTQFRKSLLKFNDEHLTGVLYNATHVNNYKIKPFNSSIYYGCYSIEEYDDINDTHRFPQHCYDGILPAIYTPAYFESSRVGSENCDRKMPDIAIPRNNFIYFEIKKSFFSTCSFWFLPVFEPVLKNGLENGDLIYKCFVQWAVWQLGCFTSVYWESYLTREFSALNVSSECYEAVKEFTPCQNLIIDEHCFLENSKKILSDVSVKNLFNWINVLNKINFKPKQMNSTKECLVNSSLILHPVRQQVIKNSVEYHIANVNISQSYYIKTCSENDSPSIIPKNLINLSKPWIQQPNVLLLIVFNYPHPEVIPLLEIIHRPIYPYILYCGFEMLKQNLIFNYRISFATYFQQHGQTAGSLNYQCILKAMRMGYDIDGIFLIADDVYIKTELSKLNIEKNKFFRIGLVGDLKFMKQCSPPSIDCSLPMIWYRWGGFGGSLHTILSEWRELGEKYPELKIARERLQNFTKAEMRMWGSTADIGYLSKTYFKTAYKMLHMFAKHQVFLEIALPTTLTSITKK
ncbi:hypothetical protein HELRODRAFT_159876 [Helobdella robusta]|uniref:Uncharacterized protein n=1 Tax=Helobdella robusta TaxID=6412 RepID=T1EPH4_HELRO|nr:hypothetical protein HELRODRAFT_159876 [Helobdella robusta]ESO13238.1 hypothetical protein HELRODRAFT_159876 [Helobdella robusta]